MKRLAPRHAMGAVNIMISCVAVAETPMGEHVTEISAGGATGSDVVKRLEALQKIVTRMAGEGRLRTRGAGRSCA